MSYEELFKIKFIDFILSNTNLIESVNRIKRQITFKLGRKSFMRNSYCICNYSFIDDCLVNIVEFASTQEEPTQDIAEFNMSNKNLLMEFQKYTDDVVCLTITDRGFLPEGCG